MSEYLFTYGTLRLNQDHPMASLIADNATLIGLAVISNAKLFRIEWFPAMINSESKKNCVVGDLYLLKNNSVLEKLDEYECISVGEPPFEYRRVKTTVKTDTEEIDSWAYFYNIPIPQYAELIESGDFLNP